MLMEITKIHTEVIKVKIKMDQCLIVKIMPTGNSGLLSSKQIMEMFHQTRKTRELTYLSNFSSAQW
jgi:hypothetical protein